MSDIAIRVENVSKLYRIGTAPERYRTLRDTLVNGVRSTLQRLPLALGAGRAEARSDGSTIWALKDVSFDVRRGQVSGAMALANPPCSRSSPASPSPAPARPRSTAGSGRCWRWAPASIPS